MQLPVMPPIAPMLAKPVNEIPAGHVEPKWDGFRTIVFKDGVELELGSRNERPMTRYFPELVEQLRAQLPERCVVDGEIVLIRADRLDFEALQQRIHPAASRVNLLAAQTPASFIAFDLLAIGEHNLMAQPFAERRRQLVDSLDKVIAPVYVTPATTDLETAQEWFEKFEGAGLDGLIVKPEDGSYQPDKRVQFKVKHQRTADCVLAGYRWHKSGDVIGSLLLGLYDEANQLHHVGVAASFTMAARRSLVNELAPLVIDISRHPWGEWMAQAQAVGARMPGSSAGSRWSAGKDLSFVPLRPERVIEVAYDQMEGDRFRHTAHFRRWRPDRKAESCNYGQLDRPKDFELAKILALRQG